MNFFDPLTETDANLISFSALAADLDAASLTARRAPHEVLQSAGISDAPIKCADAAEAAEIAASIADIIERKHYHFNSWHDSFASTLELIEHALEKDEEKYLAKVRTMKREALDAAVEVYGHLSRMWTGYVLDDVLGLVYRDVASHANKQVMGQYFTPSSICHFMAKMTLGDVKAEIARAREEGRKIKVHDPCVGSGAMLLAAKKVVLEQAGLSGLDEFEFYGQDIDPLCVRMAKIQMRLTDYRHMADLMIVTAYEMREKRSQAQ